MVKRNSKTQKWEDHLGEVYNSKSKMCRAWGVSVGVYDNRLKSGSSLEQALTAQTGTADDFGEYLGVSVKKLGSALKIKIRAGGFDKAKERIEKALWSNPRFLGHNENEEVLYRNIDGEIYVTTLQNYLDVVGIELKGIEQDDSEEYSLQADTEITVKELICRLYDESGMEIPRICLELKERYKPSFIRDILFEAGLQEGDGNRLILRGKHVSFYMDTKKRVG